MVRWRSVLFVPGNRHDLAAKTIRYGPDAVVLDLEDAVPPSGKVAAREHVARAAAELAGAVPLCVRVNPPGTEWFTDDVSSLPAGLAAVVVPKLESRAHADAVSDAVGDHALIAGIETVLGVADAREVLRGPPFVGCYFGAEDYVADLGGVRTDGNAEVAWARSFVVVAARLAGIPAFDMVTIDFGDDARFVAEAREARALGYCGKLCIHPRQVGFWRRGSWRRLRRRTAAPPFGARVRTRSVPVAFEGQMVDEVCYGGPFAQCSPPPPTQHAAGGFVDRLFPPR